MPRILFKDRVTSLAKLPSSHVVGILLTIVIVSLTDEGISLFEEVFRPVGSKTGDTERLNNMRYVLSMMLAYWSWLKQEYYWECGDRVEQKRAETVIQTMLEELIKFWPRGEGNGWFKAKVHEQLHVPGDISRNGSPRNTYTGPVENNHLDVKEQAMRTQMNRSLLDEQIGNRSAEAYIINYAYERICNREDTPKVSNIDEYCGRGPRASAGKLVLCWPGGNRPVSQFSWTSGSRGCPPFPALAI
jgi:hypothetical protein